MSSYGPLAACYDRLTGDVSYSEFADFYEAEFNRRGGEFRLLLDLCCGTRELASRGYDMIGVDASVDMLMQARDKAYAEGFQPLFLCQDASELDLYGTVDAALCSLDGINYINPAQLPELFRRLGLFVRPGGLFIFDIRPEQWLRSRDGDIFVDEDKNLMCLWRADFDEEEKALVYGMDIFSRRGKLWERSKEEHIEYAHSEEFLRAELEKHGFENIRFTTSCPQGNMGRVFVIANRKD